MALDYGIIKRPVISEKGTLQSENLGVYAFEVKGCANKNQIKQAVEKLFNVNVLSVRTMNVHGKTKRVGRFVTKRSNWKKASVTLKKGQKIEFIQGV